MTKNEMIALAQGQLDAYNSRDIEKFCTFFHPEVIVHKFVSNTVGCQGMHDYKKMYGDMFAASPKLHCELKSRIVLDSFVYDEEWVTGLGDSPPRHVVVIYGFRDGLIDRIWLPR